jgi:hypothetical protein
MTISYNATNNVYTLYRIDAEELEKFVTKRNVKGFVMVVHNMQV